MLVSIRNSRSRHLGNDSMICHSIFFPLNSRGLGKESLVITHCPFLSSKSQSILTCCVIREICLRLTSSVLDCPKVLVVIKMRSKKYKMYFIINEASNSSQIRAIQSSLAAFQIAQNTKVLQIIVRFF